MDSQKTPHNALCDQAFDDYTIMSAKAGYYSSSIARAIEFYRKHGEEVNNVSKPKNIERVSQLISATVNLNKLIQRLMYDVQIEQPDLDEDHNAAEGNLEEAIECIEEVQKMVDTHKAE